MIFTVWTTKDCLILSEVPVILLIYLRELTKHFSNNGRPSWKHIIQIPGQRGYPKSGILYAIWEPTSSEVTLHKPKQGLVDDVRSAFHLPYISKEGYETLEQQWMSLPTIYHLVSHAEGYSTSDKYLCAIWVLMPQQKRHSANHNGQMDAIRSLPIFHIHPREVMKHFSSNECLSLKLEALQPISHAEWVLTHNLAFWIQFQGQPW